MFIRAYLRASTEDQFADRAKEMLEQFVQERGHKIASYYRENISGTKLDRPEQGRLLMDSHHNDILLVEQIDRLTRLSNSDWITLKKQIEQHGFGDPGPVFHTIVSIKNDGHYFCGAGGNRPDGSDEALTLSLLYFNDKKRVFFRRLIYLMIYSPIIIKHHCSTMVLNINHHLTSHSI